MKRIAQAMIGMVLGVGLGSVSAWFGEALLAAPRQDPPLQNSRTYQCDPTGWALIVDGSYGSRYGQPCTCSDGSVVTFVRIECESRGGARLTRDQVLRGACPTLQLGPVVQRIPAGAGAIVQFRKPIRIQGDPAVRTGEWAYIDVDGRDLRMIYGPTKDHVVELLATNPCDKW